MVPLYQSVIWLAPCHHISQSFDLPTTTTSVSHLTCPLPPHYQSELVLEIELALALDIECYRITASVSHLTCPLPPHQSVIWLAHCHHISQSFDLPSTTTLPHWSVIWLAPTTTSVNHLTCPHHQSGSHLTCPLPPHNYVLITPCSSSSSSTSSSTSARELEIIEKFLCPRHLLVHKVQNFFLPSCSGWVSPPPHISPPLKLHSFLSKTMIRRSPPPPKILGQKAIKQPLRWL